MKKLFFSAIALVAFSSVSMGNTIEIKEVEVLEIKEIQLNLDPIGVHDDTKCEDMFFATLNSATENGFSFRKSLSMANAVYETCMKD